MLKLKKIIISLVLSLTLMSVFSLCVSAKVTTTDYTDRTVICYENENFNGSIAAYNAGPVAYQNFLPTSSQYQAFSYEIVVNNTESFWSITDIEWVDSSDHSKGFNRFKVTMPAARSVVYTGYPSIDTCNETRFKTSGLTSYFFYVNSSTYSQHNYVKLDLRYCGGVIDGLMNAGDTLTYYDYDGNEITISYNGDSIGPDGFGGGSADRFPGEVSEEPSLDDYLPDFNDSKYNPGDLSSYLPTAPDSLDVLDWLKYFIECVKAFFNWAVDTFKAKILLLYDTITGLFNFLKDYLTYFLDKLKQALFDLFVPSDDFAQSAIDKFSQVELSSTFLNSTVAPVLDAFKNTYDRSPKKYEFTVFGADCSFDFSSIQSVIPVTDAIIIFFSYFFGLKHLLFSFLNLFSTIKKEGD